VERHTTIAFNFIRALPGAAHVTVAVLYVTMGLLAALVAFGLRSEAPDIREAIRTLKEQPFGPALLVIIAVGSACLVFWRILQAIGDLEEKGRTILGLCHRARFLFGAAIYAGVPVFVCQILTGGPARSGEQLVEEAAGNMIRFPFGWTIIVASGLGFLAGGGYCLYRMMRGNFHAWFHCNEMSETQRQICFALGRLGYGARGIIFLVVGYFLTLAGWNLNPTQVEGQAGALQSIFRQPLGPAWLGMISLGLVAFGIFSLLAIRYGRVPEKKTREVLSAISKSQKSIASALSP
jgi:hypothetical protein